MDLDDIAFCQDYFRQERRDPTITEIRMIDTYWSDHCRHTTFGTILDDVQIDDAAVQEAFDRYLAMREELGRSQEAPLPDGPGHHRRQGAEEAGHPEEPGRVRGDQRLHRQDQRATSTARTRTGCFCSRTRPTTTPPRSSRSAARPPASAAPSATRCPAAATSIRPCA